MFSKIGFYLKGTVLLLTLAVSSLVSCAGASYSTNESDGGVTDVTTGGSSAVSSRQSATGGQSTPQSSVVSQSTGGQTAVSSQQSASGGSPSSILYAAGYNQGAYLGGSILPQGVSVGECPSNYVRSDCMCAPGGTNSFTTFDDTCSDNTLKNCIAKTVCTNLSCPMYSYFWQCNLLSLKASEVVATDGSAAVAATGGSAAVAATGGSAAVAATGGSAAVAATGGSAAVAAVPTTYSVTYQNQVASQSIQAPGTCPLGQSIIACTCVISGMQSVLTSCNPTACQIENSKQYPQSTFDWTCV